MNSSCDRPSKVSSLLSKSDINQIPMGLKLQRCSGPTGQHWWKKRIVEDIMEDVTHYFCHYCDSSGPKPEHQPAPAQEKVCRTPTTGVKQMLREWCKFRD